MSQKAFSWKSMSGNIGVRQYHFHENATKQEPIKEIVKELHKQRIKVTLCKRFDFIKDGAYNS